MLTRGILAGGVVASSVILMGWAVPSEAVVIADFNVNQSVTYGPAPAGFATNTISNGLILGGHRDVTARITGFINQATQGRAEAYSNIFNPSNFDTILSNNTFGVFTIVWDGSAAFSGDTPAGNIGTPAAFNLNVDLTNGGNSDRFHIVATNDGQPRGNMRVRVWNTTGTAWADAFTVFQGSNVWTDYYLLFNSFTVTGSSSFDFSQVGAIALQIDARSSSFGGPLVAGLDTTVDLFETTGGIPEPVTLGLGGLAMSALAVATLRRNRV